MNSSAMKCYLLIILSVLISMSFYYGMYLHGIIDIILFIYVLRELILSKWNVGIWKSGGFAIFHYEWKWNDGTQKRLYFLLWEFNFVKKE